MLAVDERGRRASRHRHYLHRPPVLSAALGSVQALEGDGMFIGWGDSSYFTEYDASGRVALDAHLSGGVVSYRAFLDGWEGGLRTCPAWPRSVSLVGGARGSTRAGTARPSTAAGGCSGGPNATMLAPLGTAVVDGFETAITIPGQPAWLAVEALDGAGRPLERSQAVRA